MSEHTNPVEIDDLIVLLLGATPDNAVKGITRLEKMIFVLERETPVGELLTEESEYQPYRFGPFSPKIYEAVESLRAAGLVWDTATDTDEQAEFQATFDLG